MGEDVSLFLSRCLDSFGYNENMIFFRRTAYKEINKAYKNALDSVGIKTVIEGSTAEGLSSTFERSCDILMVRKNVTCFSVVDHQHLQYPEERLIFKAEHGDVPPGYTRLTLEQSPVGIFYEDDVYSSIFGEEKKYLWSIYYFNRMKNKFKADTKVLQEIGPLVGRSLKAHIGNFRINFPLQYVEEELPSKLVNRYNSQFEWPSEGLIEEIARQKVFVVPEVSQDSEMSHLEWRICYQQADLQLFQSLNITQVKLYILLKMIAKSTLQPISKAMSSYVMKNVVFWMAQSFSRDIFHERNLVLLLLAALGMLYNGIKCGNVPCYLDEERNLLVPHLLRIPTRHRLLVMLSILQQEKACMFLRCEKLRCVMLMKFSSPEIIEQYGSERDKLEKLLLILNVIQSRYVSHVDQRKPFIKDQDWIRVAKAVFDIVLPGWMERYMMGENTSHIVLRRIQEILG